MTESPSLFVPSNQYNYLRLHLNRRAVGEVVRLRQRPMSPRWVCGHRERKWRAVCGAGAVTESSSSSKRLRVVMCQSTAFIFVNWGQVASPPGLTPIIVLRDTCVWLILTYRNHLL